MVIHSISHHRFSPTQSPWSVAEIKSFIMDIVQAIVSHRNAVSL